MTHRFLKKKQTYNIVKHHQYTDPGRLLESTHADVGICYWKALHSPHPYPSPFPQLPTTLFIFHYQPTTHYILTISSDFHSWPQRAEVVPNQVELQMLQVLVPLSQCNPLNQLNLASLFRLGMFLLLGFSVFFCGIIHVHL